jgi:hypothetical protein
MDAPIVLSRPPGVWGDFPKSEFNAPEIGKQLRMYAAELIVGTITRNI